MNLLFTSRSTKSGTWKIRGEQLGQASGAVVTPRASLDQCKAASVIFVVKKVDDELLGVIRASGQPWAFDVLDLYPQPACSDWSRQEAVEWVRHKLRLLSPTALVWPNQKMREDCDIGLPGIVLPHHYRPGIGINPVRDNVSLVGYEGEPKYLGGWFDILASECKRRGWRFVTNPSRLAEVDIVVAVRAGQSACYATKNWKSNVKLENAHGSGTPFVGNRECGYLETATGCEYWADSARELTLSFNWLESQSIREQISDRFRARAFPVERAAEQLIEFLQGIK